MAMRELFASAGSRLPVLVQHMWAAGATTASSSLAAGPQRKLHTGRLGNPWEEVLRVAKSNPEKLHEIVDTLTNHCIKAQAAPPLDTYNELLRICDMHSDVASVHKLCQMACAVRMHLDHNTFDRLQAAYSYFPKPYATHPPAAASAGRDGTRPSPAQHSAAAARRATSSTGTSTTTSAETNTSSSSSAGGGSTRIGSILEAPASSNVPSISTTGGASSVSVGSSGSGSVSATRNSSVKLTHTAQTNVWVASTVMSSSVLRAQQQQQQQQPQQQQVVGVAEVDDSGPAAPSVNAPDASA